MKGRNCATTILAAKISRTLVRKQRQKPPQQSNWAGGSVRKQQQCANAQKEAKITPTLKMVVRIFSREYIHKHNTHVRTYTHANCPCYAFGISWKLYPADKLLLRNPHQGVSNPALVKGIHLCFSCLWLRLEMIVGIATFYWPRERESRCKFRKCTRNIHQALLRLCPLYADVL